MKVIILVLSIFLILLFAGCDTQGERGPSQESTAQKGGGNDSDDSIAPDEGGPPSADESIPLPARDCGSEEIDPESGERIFVPDVDIVVSYLEIFSTDFGAWIRPTVKNQCGDPAIGELIISIRSDSEADTGLLTTSAMVNVPGHAEAVWAYALGVPLGASYTVVANWGNGLQEANYRNNTCVRSTSGSCL